MGVDGLLPNVDVILLEDGENSLVNESSFAGEDNGREGDNGVEVVVALDIEEEAEPGQDDHDGEVDNLHVEGGGGEEHHDRALAVAGKLLEAGVNHVGQAAYDEGEEQHKRQPGFLHVEALYHG